MCVGFIVGNVALVLLRDFRFFPYQDGPPLLHALYDVFTLEYNLSNSERI